MLESLAKTGVAVTAEEHRVVGGLGDAVRQVAAEQHPVPVFALGMADEFGVSGTAEACMEHFGLTPSGDRRSRPRGAAEEAAGPASADPRRRLGLRASLDRTCEPHPNACLRCCPLTERGANLSVCPRPQAIPSMARRQTSPELRARLRGQRRGPSISPSAGRSRPLSNSESHQGLPRWTPRAGAGQPPGRSWRIRLPRRPNRLRQVDPDQAADQGARRRPRARC